MIWEDRGHVLFIFINLDTLSGMEYDQSILDKLNLNDDSMQRYPQGGSLSYPKERAFTLGLLFVFVFFYLIENYEN